MHTQPKLAVALLAVLCAAPFVRAQDAPSDRPPDNAPGAYATDPGPMPGAVGDPGAWAQPDDSGDRGAWDQPDGRGDRGGWSRGGRQGGWGGPGRGMHGGMRGGADMMLARMVRNPSFREKLGITADQAAKISQESSDFRKSEIRSRAEVEIKGLELRDLLSADNPDRAAIDKKLEDISAARLAQAKAAVDFRLSARNWLTPDQRQKLEQMRQQFSRRGPGQGHASWRGQGSRGPRASRGPQGPGAAPSSAPPNPPSTN
jgi:Spy/CpxP family protein refolding chaperone